MKERILDDLALYCDCFISDLKAIRFHQKIRGFLLVKANQYSCEELNYCLSYLLNESFAFPNTKEIVHYVKTAFPIC
ncbi:hypothetical protein CLOSTMETH_02703 [[Clostridium] methylpentosum DSM 5476]|uniref:Uncharacterized protein n=1 Tax=[Clostridium] methylpentosum DSM 5476 TaxID=537013 RepID=C0EFR1_9FIRM|nr:hypothetical protein CLOSTMETH_02703 [[Clostridium] methylpentosum DSM 5476]